MKSAQKFIALTLAFGLLFAGCGTVAWDTQAAVPYSRPPGSSAQSGGEPVRKAPLPRKETGTAPVIEGEHTILRTEPSVAGEGAVLTDAFQTGEYLVLLWNGPDGSALEIVDPSTGESIYQNAVPGNPGSVGAAADAPGEFRVSLDGQADYYSAADQAAVTTRELPEPVRNAVWRDGMGVPYDLQKSGGPIAYAAADGVYVTDAGGGNAKKVLDNAAISDWLGYWGVEEQLPENAGSRLHYIAPLLLEGGKRLAATAYFAGERAEDSRCLGVAAIELATNRISYFPDPVNAPARRIGADALAATGDAGYVRISPSTGETELIPYNAVPEGARSYDYKTFARLDPVEYDDGYREFSLVTYPARQPEAAAALLTLGGYPRTVIPAVTEEYVLIEAESPAGELTRLAVRYA